MTTVPARDTAQAFRLKFREWLADNLDSRWRDISRGTDEDFAVEVRRAWGARLAEGGWAAPSWPERYGGRGLAVDEQIIVLEELVAAGAPEALNSNGISIFAPILIRHGREEQKQRYLRPMLAHTEIWCQGFSEPNAGSDLASLKTTARLADDHYLLNGQKLWTSFAPYSQYCYVMVRTDPAAPKHEGISLMILEMNQPGVSVRRVRHIGGGDEFAEVFLDDAVVPRENLVGELNRGWQIATEALALERGLSFAERSLRLRREVGNVRRLADRVGVTEDPRVRARLVDHYIRAKALHSLVLRVLLLADDPEAVGPLASLAKLYWSESHQQLLDTALMALGDRVGDPEHREWLRAFLFARGETIYAGTSEIQRNLIARSIGVTGARLATPAGRNR